jgi:hypothetical protein
MPRLNWVFERSVFFLYAHDPDDPDKYIGPLGTGVLIGIEGQGSWYIRHVYAVSCWHVVHQHGASIIRINTRDGASRYIEFDPIEWQFPPNGDDLAVVDVSDRFDRETDEISTLPYSMFATKKFIEQDEVGIGEDGFMLGLFADNPGIKKNLVAARFGNISLLADDAHPVEQPNRVKRPSHIFDMRSRPGFSGSPVFVYRTPAGDLRSATERGRDKPPRNQIRMNRIRGNRFDYNDWAERKEVEDNTFLMLLGIHAGQYPERVTVSKVKRKARAEADDGAIRDGDKLRIPSSMTVVVPVWEIENLLLSNETLVDQRKERDDRMNKRDDGKNIPIPESATDDDVPPANGENPKHREDFTRLVGAAARKPVPKD